MLKDLTERKQEEIRLRLAEKMAGEITLSKSPGLTLKKWRESFEITQTILSRFLHMTPSVISDYESGRRKSPGTQVIARIVESILKIDELNGGNKIKTYESIIDKGLSVEIILDIHEYETPCSLFDFTRMINGEMITPLVKKNIYGFTIIDSLQAILNLNANDFYRLYGWSTERALIFTKVSNGRSPMVALRVTNFKPGAVVLHGIKPEDVDIIAIKIAEKENIPLLTTRMKIQKISENLKDREAE